MVRGIAGNELVEQRGRNICGEPSHHAYAGIVEVRLNGGEGRARSPQWHRVLLIPGIVNVAEAGAYFVVDVVIDLEQLLAPVRGQRGSCVPLILQTVGGYAIRCGNQRGQSGSNRGILNRHLIARKWLARHQASGGGKTIDQLGNYWAFQARGPTTRTLVTEVSCAIGRGWNYRLRKEARSRRQIASPFFRPEEKRFLLRGIVVTGNVHRAADGKTEVVLLVFRH